jgi:valyl-tRNA synthetase
MVQVINEYGKMIVGDENLKGKKTAEAKEVVAAWLREQGLMISEEEIKQNIGTAERTGGIIEPLPKLQWFIGVTKEFKIARSHIEGITDGQTVTLKQLMKQVVDNGQINIMPDRFAKIYSHWIDNLRDWCISRQIWFGHQIPVWYKGNEIHCDINPPEGDGWTQDEDTLDTWFSSGLWTFSTLGCGMG